VCRGQLEFASISFKFFVLNLHDHSKFKPTEFCLDSEDVLGVGLYIFFCLLFIVFIIYHSMLLITLSKNTYLVAIYFFLYSLNCKFGEKFWFYSVLCLVRCLVYKDNRICANGGAVCLLLCG